jgi:acetyl esterase/lipase
MLDRFADGKRHDNRPRNEAPMKIARLRPLAVLSLIVVGPLRAADEVQIQADVVYGHKDGMALTFDVLKPAKPNGAGVLFIQSGGWYSPWVEPKQLVPASQPLLTKGLTVFIVRHGSAPKYAVPDAVGDMRRSVRFIRLRAKDYGVDAERLGALGGSAGGHLALMLATTADDGDPKAKEEVLRQTNRIAAAVALFPPTDLRGWVNNPPEAIKKVPALKPPLTFDEAKEEACSPLLHVTAKTAPTLLIHGDKDELVPISHSKNIMAVFEKEKVDSKLLVIEGAAHGFSAKQNQTLVVPGMVEWFEKHLVEARKQ